MAVRPFFGHKVAGRKPQRRHKAHRGFARRPSLAARGVSDIERIGIVGDLAVRQVDDARGVNDKRNDIKKAIVAEYNEELVNRALRYCDDFVAPGLDAPEEELREVEAINEAVFESAGVSPEERPRFIEAAISKAIDDRCSDTLSWMMLLLT